MGRDLVVGIRLASGKVCVRKNPCLIPVSFRETFTSGRVMLPLCLVGPPLLVGDRCPLYVCLRICFQLLLLFIPSASWEVRIPHCIAVLVVCKDDLPPYARLWLDPFSKRLLAFLCALHSLAIIRAPCKVSTEALLESRNTADGVCGVCVALR